MANGIKREPELQALLPSPKPRMPLSPNAIKFYLRILGLFLIAIGFLIFAAFQAKGIYTDYKVKDQLEYVNGKIDGKCRTDLFVLTGCNVKITITGKTYPKKILFIDFTNDDYRVAALRDPNNFDYVTLDLAIEKLETRAVVVLLFIAASGLLFWLLISLLIKRPVFRHIFDTLNRGNIELALYRFDKKKWAEKNAISYPLEIDGKFQKMRFVVPKKKDQFMPFILNDQTGAYMVVVYDPPSEYFVILNQSLTLLDMNKAQRKSLKDKINQYIAQQA